MSTAEISPEINLEKARAVAATVVDPELPMLTLDDLGVIRDVTCVGERVTVTITPTYSGCPAVATMRDDLVHALERAGFEADVRMSLAPAWTTDWITEAGRTALAEHGISPPGPAPRGPVLLALQPVRRAVRCPQCGSAEAALVSEFSSTACKALYRCSSCAEPFDHVKEI